MQEKQIVYLKLKDIKPYEKNARKNDKAVDAVVSSILEFGFQNPIIIDKDNVIIAGHTRLKAAKKLKLKEAPCIIAGDLTEEQVKAFRLVDNKTSELAEWDYSLLDFEIGEILNIDMEQFGFDFFDPAEEKQKNAETTQQRVANILNLEHAQFEGAGKYDIPEIEPVYDLPEIKEWIGFNYVLSDDEPEGKAVHFFIDDYQFTRIWNNPEKYVDKLKRYVCVAAPDFSPYGDMPLATQIFNHYRKHWVACYLQEHGVTVIPTVRASTDERSLDFYLEGTPKNSIVMISNMWQNTADEKEYFQKEYNTMLNVLKPCKIFVYGREEQLSGNVEFVKTFADKRWGR